MDELWVIFAKRFSDLSMDEVLVLMTIFAACIVLVVSAIGILVQQLRDKAQQDQLESVALRSVLTGLDTDPYRETRVSHTD